MEGIRGIFPEVNDIAELERVYEAGWKLGNSYREWDRMFRIYRQGEVQWKDPEEFRKEFIADESKRKLLDEPGHTEKWHERAGEILADYDLKTKVILERMYKEDPEFLKGDTFNMAATRHLLEAKTRLGELSVFMTANPRGLAEGLVRYTELYKYCFAVACDEDMIGGGKEIAIEGLIRKIGSAGLVVPRDRLVAIGDSERGDVGSGFKLMQKGGYTFQGVLTRNTMSEVDVFKEAARTDPDLREMLEKMEVTTVANNDVPKIDGQFKFGRLGSAAAALAEKKRQENKES